MIVGTDKVLWEAGGARDWMHPLRSSQTGWQGGRPWVRSTRNGHIPEVESPKTTSVLENASQPPGHKRKKVAVSTAGGERPLALSEGRLSLATRERRTKAKGVLLTKGEIICMKITLHIEDLFHLWHHQHLVHTPVPHENSIIKYPKGREIGRHLIAKR